MPQKILRIVLIGAGCALLLSQSPARPAVRPGQAGAPPVQAAPAAAPGPAEGFPGLALGVAWYPEQWD
jgi:hypothetical protein